MDSTGGDWSYRWSFRQLNFIRTHLKELRDRISSEVKGRENAERELQAERKKTEEEKRRREATEEENENLNGQIFRLHAQLKEAQHAKADACAAA